MASIIQTITELEQQSGKPGNLSHLIGEIEEKLPYTLVVRFRSVHKGNYGPQELIQFAREAIVHARRMRPVTFRENSVSRDEIRDSYRN
ncbi:hypothetical protein CHUAL_009653 [Chamberlinius hualienensis]